MPKYIVQDTNILHGEKGDKEATLYGPGDEIELSEEQAAALGDHVAIETEENAPKAKRKK